MPFRVDQFVLGLFKPEGAAKATNQSHRVAGLDSLRYVLALWVVINHVGAPPMLHFIPRTAQGVYLIRSMFENAFNGQAAVAMFFVVSGFCIHFPFRGAREIASVTRFYARRNVRIILPAIVAAVVSEKVGIHLGSLNHSILWSLVCEEIYYILYPGLRWLASLSSWPKLLTGTAALSIIPILVHPSTRYLSDFGLELTWFVGLPYWLAGCVLAERFESHGVPAAPRAGRLWCLRAAMLALASGSSLLLFHSPIGLPWTLPAIALVGAFWIEAEVGRASLWGPSRFERLGAHSYSVYLFHLAAWKGLGLAWPMSVVTVPGWTVSILTILATCWIAYLLVERPSHRLARSISHIVSEPPRLVGAS